MKPYGPTLEDLRIRQAKRLAEIKDREAEYYRKQQRLLRLAALGFGLLVPVGAYCGTIAGSMSWWVLVILAILSAGLAALVVHRGWGIFLGTVAMGGGTVLTGWLCMEFGWWNIYGPISLFILIFVWLLSAFMGGILGMFSAQFDNDNHLI